jgi:serine/threonine protein phosphatase PrpC
MNPGVPANDIGARVPGIKVATATHIGTRQENADAVLTDEVAGLFAVTDGMDDLAGSILVSREALETVQQMFGTGWASLSPAERDPEDAKRRIVEGIRRADWHLCVPYLPVTRRIGTTFAGIVVCGDTLCVAHVGDSRVYLLRRSNARLTQLTADHTVLEEDLGRGVPHDVAILNRDAHKLTRVLGVMPGGEVEAILHRWRPDDTALLCSDGISDCVEGETLKTILLEVEDLPEAAQSIVDRARKAGGRDNATVVLVKRDR